MKDPDAARRQTRRQGAHNTLAALDGHMLQHDVRVHQIELAIERREVIVAEPEPHVRGAGCVAVSASLSEHRWRDIHARHFPAARRERNENTPNSASEVECPLWPEGGIEATANDGQKALEMNFAGAEEGRARLGRELSMVLRVTEDGEVWVGLTKALPIPI